MIEATVVTSLVPDDELVGVVLVTPPGPVDAIDPAVMKSVEMGPFVVTGVVVLVTVVLVTVVLRGVTSTLMMGTWPAPERENE